MIDPVHTKETASVKTIGNILWFVIVGIASAIGWLIIAAALAVTVVGLPFARQCVKLARFSAWPFGRQAMPSANAAAMSGLGQIIWIVLAGWWLALGYIVGGVILCITVIGIPFGLQSFKLATLSFAPFGKEIVSSNAVRAQWSTPVAGM